MGKQRTPSRGSIVNCHNYGVVTGAGIRTGGLVGFLKWAEADKCTNNEKVYGTSTVKSSGTADRRGTGGIAGHMEDCIVKNCVNNADITGEGSNIGGICGYSYGYDSRITRSINNGNIVGKNDSVGGISGYLYPDSNKINSVINNGVIKGETRWDTGGIVGKGKGYLYACFNNGTSITFADPSYNKPKFYGSFDAVTKSCLVGNVTIGDADAVDYYEQYTLTLDTLKTGKGACILREADPAAGWVQQLGVDDLPRLSDDPSEILNYSVFEGINGYHNHLSGATSCPDCGALPIEPPYDAEKGGYQISTVNHLYWFNVYGVDKNAVLTNDIVANENLSSPTKIWNPVGTSSKPFTGIFDGQGHTISGLYFSNDTVDYVGLFGVIGSGGSVSNIGVVDSSFNGNDYVGAIAGSNKGTISGCFSKAEINGTGNVGGIVGNGTTNVTNSFFLDTCVSASPYDSAFSKAIEKFTSGEVAYLLNGDQSRLVWGMKINGTNNTPTAYTEQNRVFSSGGYHNHTNDILNARYCSLCNEFLPIKPVLNDNGEYEIDSRNKLYWFAGYVNGTLANETKHSDAKAVLTANITVNSDLFDESGNLTPGTKVAWVPAGNYSEGFTGSFDGQGYTIKGLYQYDLSDYCGLFGKIENGGTVKNLGITDSYFYSPSAQSGVIAGTNNGTISGCYTYNVTPAGSTDNGIFAAGTGTAANSFTNASTAVVGAQKPADKFANGEVAYNLNEDPAVPVWGQLIDSDLLPVPATTTNRVYYAQGKYHNHTSTPCDICPTMPGKDTEGNYLISTEKDLLWLAYYINSGNSANAVLANDIAVSDSFVMTPVGTTANPFNGTFDGKCFAISGLNIISTAENVGLFGVIGTSGTVSNVAVTNSTISGGNNVGGIAGTNNGKISGCYTYGVTLTGTTADGIFAAGTGTAEHSFSDAATANGAQKTAAQFENGDVAYNLNTDPGNPVWGQLIDTDPLPVAATAANKVFYARGNYHNHYTGTVCPYCPNEPTNIGGVYQIYTAQNLLWFAEHVNSGNSAAKAVLCDNIEITSDISMVPVGTAANPFGGSFGGNGYTISGLTFADTASDN
ncbi:MAG: hypothetical protein ACI4J8_10270, partial [Oscillospiraceae bacterium]